MRSLPMGCAFVAAVFMVPATGTAQVAQRRPDAPGVVESTESAHFKVNPGFQVGVRVAYTDGLGVIYQGLNLSDASSGALPILVDIGWRLLPELYVGIYGQYAPVFLKTYALTCPTGWSCSAEDWRFGVEGDYHLPPSVRFDSQFDPYVGLGVGYEVLQSSFHGTQGVPTQGPMVMLVPATFDESYTDRGWEFVSLTLGADWRFSNMLGAGLFLTGSLGEYDVQTSSATVTPKGGATQALVVAPLERTVHELAFVGVRGTLNL